MIELNQISMLKEIIWKQKFKVLWLNDGDHNMSFFHRMTPSRRRANVTTPPMVGLNDNALV